MTAERPPMSEAEVNPRPGDELFARLQPSSPGAFPSVADAVYDRLWRRIVNREFEPGDRLVEETLAQELGTSRTPVREALLRLGQTGLVQVSSRKGFSVPITSPADITELYDLRSAIETYAIRRATPLISDDEIAVPRGVQETVLSRWQSARARPGDRRGVLPGRPGVAFDFACARRESAQHAYPLRSHGAIESAQYAGIAHPGTQSPGDCGTSGHTRRAGSA